MSRTVSDDPLAPATVDSRARTFVFLPTPLKKLADVMWEMSRVTSNSPHAPAALACTTLIVVSVVFGSWIERRYIPFWYPLAREMCESLDELGI